jgi:hypothetical protein
LAAVLLIVLVAGTGGYLLLMRANQNAPQNTQVIPFQPSPTLLVQFQRSLQATWSAPVPTSTQISVTPIYKLYRNERLGFEFNYLEGFELMEETADKVSFGYIYPSLTVSTGEIIDYSSYRPCEYIDENTIKTLPCLESGVIRGQKGDIIETKLGQVNAKSFYIAEKYPTEAYPHAYYHIVQTTSSPKIEAKMFLAHSAPKVFDLAFKQMLSTFKLLDSE